MTIYFYTYFYTTIFRTSTAVTSSTVTSETVLSAPGTDYAEASSSMLEWASSLQDAASASARSQMPPTITASLTRTSSTSLGIARATTLNGADGVSSTASKMGGMGISLLVWIMGIMLAAI